VCRKKDKMEYYGSPKKRVVRYDESLVDGGKKEKSESKKTNDVDSE